MCAAHFLSLEAGDILFVDTTHTVKIGSDVNRVILEVLPRPPPGDRALPRHLPAYEYPIEFFTKLGFSWAEQYLLQAFLALNRDYEILFGNAALAREHHDEILRLTMRSCDSRRVSPARRDRAPSGSASARSRRADIAGCAGQYDPRVTASPQQLQHDFYAATAEAYDREFVAGDDAHGVALDFISMLIAGTGCRSVLDVGAGTGRGPRHFLARHPGLQVRGVEPVRAMIEVAERNHAIPTGAIIEASGDALPFADASFDAVCELGVLHHIADPEPVVREMTRVARRAVFLSDENRFARGRRPVRWAKYALYRAGLWDSLWRLRTHGRGYHQSADGVSYSYSVYDSLDTLSAWADRMFLIPTARARAGWFHPLFGATHILVCALRDG